MTDIDRLDHLLEHRAQLLASSTSLLQAAITERRPFTEREAGNWDWALNKIDELAHDAQELTTSLKHRRYDLCAPRRIAHYRQRDVR